MVSSVALAVLILGGLVDGDYAYTLDDSPGLGRKFDGVGGLSGGGVSRYAA